MKKIALMLLAAVMGACALCSCGNEQKPSSPAAVSHTEAEQTTTADIEITEAPKGNAGAFSMDTKQLGEILNGFWMNQVSYTEKIRFAEDLTFIFYDGGTRHNGKATLNENGGTLEIAFDDDFAPAKTYIWVDNPANVNANTWYVNGSTFAFGGKTYIRSTDI